MTEIVNHNTNLILHPWFLGFLYFFKKFELDYWILVGCMKKSIQLMLFSLLNGWTMDFFCSWMGKITNIDESHLKNIQTNFVLFIMSSAGFTIVIVLWWKSPLLAHHYLSKHFFGSLVPQASNKHIQLDYILGSPPSQDARDASGKWRFRLGSPILKNIVILVVTVTGQGGQPKLHLIFQCFGDRNSFCHFQFCSSNVFLQIEAQKRGFQGTKFLRWKSLNNTTLDYKNCSPEI